MRFFEGLSAVLSSRQGHTILAVYDKTALPSLLLQHLDVKDVRNSDILVTGERKTAAPTPLVFICGRGHQQEKLRTWCLRAMYQNPRVTQNVTVRAEM